MGILTKLMFVVEALQPVHREHTTMNMGEGDVDMGLADIHLPLQF